MKYVIRVILTIISVIISAFLIIAVVFYVQKIQGNTPYFLSYTGFVNTGTSMLPLIQKGDLVLLKKQDNYKVNDVISFNDGGMTVTHRIIAIDGDLYKTKGDNNKFIDGHLIQKDNVYGKMVKIIPGAGDAIKYFYEHETLFFGTLVSLLGGFIGISIGLKYVRKSSN